MQPSWMRRVRIGPFASRTKEGGRAGNEVEVRGVLGKLEVHGHRRAAHLIAGYTVAVRWSPVFGVVIHLSAIQRPST